MALACQQVVTDLVAGLAPQNRLGPLFVALKLFLQLAELLLIFLNHHQSF